MGMARTKAILMRVEEDLAQQISVRAQEREISMNEWMNRAVMAALAMQNKTLTVTVTTTVEF